MKTRPARLSSRLAAAALLALAGLIALPAHGAERCPVSQTEARPAAFDVEALFARGGTSLTPSGQARLNRFARTLNATEIEVVVISVPQPQGVAAEAWRSTSRERAAAVREHLMQVGIAPQRVYTERRPPPNTTQSAAAPLVIETVGAWDRQVAGVRGPTCVVQALPRERGRATSA
jgi:type IV pilus biogenesis protein CpaD/CtpE